MKWKSGHIRLGVASVECDNDPRGRVSLLVIFFILYTHECSEEKMIAEVVHLQLKYLKTRKGIANLVFRSVNSVQNNNTTRGVDYFLIVRMNSFYIFLAKQIVSSILLRSMNIALGGCEYWIFFLQVFMCEI